MGVGDTQGRMHFAKSILLMLLIPYVSVLFNTNRAASDMGQKVLPGLDSVILRGIGKCSFDQASPRYVQTCDQNQSILIQQGHCPPERAFQQVKWCDSPPSFPDGVLQLEMC